MKNYRYLERRNMMIRRIGLWVGEVVAAILLAFLVIQFCFQTVTVHGDSMQPAYYDGDTVLVNKLDYRIGSPKRLDAVILELENGSTTHYSVKRVVGLPGETIKIENGKIYINNKELRYKVVLYCEDIICRIRFWDYSKINISEDENKDNYRVLLAVKIQEYLILETSNVHNL